MPLLDWSPNGFRVALALAGAASLSVTAARAEAPAANEVEQVVVTASTVNMVGVAATSSQGAVTRQELELRPVYRVGQLLETIPGLAVTAHSGEGKANQYLLRGFNLDHGTDLAVFVDGMPVNMRTHTHGQGYTDLNFMIPELAGGVAFTKGPYYAAEGDFGVVGSAHIDYLDSIPTQLSVSAGGEGYGRVFAGGEHALGGGRLLAASELVHTDGPWDHGDNMRKFNAVLRYSQGVATDGFALTGMYYRGHWNATTDQPLRAIEEGAIGRFGTLDPSDGGQTERFSLSGRYGRTAGNWTLKATAYATRYQLTLINDFTHYLDDPVDGDQHAQNDRRTIAGGAISATLDRPLLGAPSKTVFGLQTRYDDVYVDLRHTARRRVLSVDRADTVQEFSAGAYAENTTKWTPWLRTIVGLREDRFHAKDHDLLGISGDGSESASLFQPKGSIVFGPFARTEFYVSAGRGFHSNDARAGLVEGGDYARPEFLVRAKGSEVGVRSTLVPHLQAAVTLFRLDFDSELVYDADAGQTEAGRPSHRTGVEFTGQYRPFHWLELSANLAMARARFTDRDPSGNYIDDAPDFIGSIGALIDNLGPWSGGVEYRNLGPHPLVSDNSVRSDGYAEWNVNLGYAIRPGLKARIDIFNLTDAEDDAADYLYTSRLQGEPAGGVEGIHLHPLEPRSARLTLTKLF